MNKKEIKQTLITVSFNKIRDLILEDKINESQAVVEALAAQLKEIDNSYINEDASFAIGDFVTLDDPDEREVININSYRDIGYLNNVYKVKQIENQYIYLKAIKDRNNEVGNTIVLPWRNQKAMKRVTKLNINSPSIVMSLYSNE